MTTVPSLNRPAAPVNCSTAEQRLLRETATQSLLARRAATTDDAERQQLLEEVVELNLEIARGIARRFRGRGAEDDDLEQVACVGLMKAATNFRPEAGVPFIGYAVPSIRGEVKRYFRDCSWTVRIPRRLQELQGKIARVVPQLVQELGREPVAEEVADRLGVDSSEVRDADAARGCFNVLSLDKPIGADDGDMLLGEAIADHEDPRLRSIETFSQLGPLIGGLDPRDRRILELSFVENWRQTDIGQELGISQMQVSRLLSKILGRLRRQLQTDDAAA
ncbi:SigB/SigF/SigG family RNA polymerase sigma factor [Kribbella sp. DT2]|uniref:SigB/SigF/SigG family RNA polymerase sigma factor n=1 Tax=Kribbella sp. DT2 TaxID=3393427 RepID=UPI003CF8B5E8